MNILEQLKSINAIQILYSEKDSKGFSGAFFGPAIKGPCEEPAWLRKALDTKKLRLHNTPQIDYAAWEIDNEYGKPIVFYPYDYVVHDGNGKIYGLEHEIVDILEGKVQKKSGNVEVVSAG